MKILILLNFTLLTSYVSVYLFNASAYAEYIILQREYIVEHWPTPIGGRVSLLRQHLKKLQNEGKEMNRLVFCMRGENYTFFDTFEGESQTFNIGASVLRMLNEREYIFLAELIPFFVKNTTTTTTTATATTNDTQQFENCNYIINFKFIKNTNMIGTVDKNIITINLDRIWSSFRLYTTLLHELGHIFALRDDYKNYNSMMCDLDGPFYNQIIFHEDIVNLYITQMKYHIYNMKNDYHLHMFQKK